ncbi:hypothetical protein Tco_0604623 [Tanacetum coccineum]
MTSFDRRLNSLYAIKECSSCGALYTANCGCSKGSLEDKILVPIPDLSQRPLKIEKICLDCGDPVHGLYCRQCALIRKTLEEVFQDFQDTSKSSDDDTNFVNQEPFVVKQGPGVNSSQSPPQIDHHCCYECGDSLDGIFCQRCTCNLLNAQNELLNSQNKLMEQMISICDMDGQIMQKKEEEKRIAEEQAAKDQYWKIPICYDDDEDDTIAVIHVLFTKDPVVSLIMEDEYLDTIPATKLDEVIKSSVENLVLIPSESEGIPDSVCDVPLCNNLTPLEAFKEHSEIVVDFNDDSTSSDDDSPYGEDIDYVDASPPDAEIVSSEVVEIVIPEVGGIDDDILLTIKDDILREKLLNVNLLIAKIEALKDNPTPSSDFMTKSSSTSLNLFLEETNTFDNSLPESETFCFNLEEISSGSTTTRSDYSLSDYEVSHLKDVHINESDCYHEEFAGELAHIISSPEYDCFYFKSEPDPGELTSIVDSGIRENVLSTTNVNLPFEDAQSPLLAYVVWIFLPFLTYPVSPPYLLSCGNEDTIFDPGISVYHMYAGCFSSGGNFHEIHVYPNHS